MNIQIYDLSDVSRANRNNFSKCCFIFGRKIVFSPLVLICGSRSMVSLDIQHILVVYNTLESLLQQLKQRNYIRSMVRLRQLSSGTCHHTSSGSCPQNRPHKVFHRGALQFCGGFRLCGGFDIIKLTKIYLFIVFHVFNLGSWSFV